LNNKSDSDTTSAGKVETQYIKFEEGILLDCGKTLAPITVAYETYGNLNPEKDNAILVLHALSGDAHAAGYHENTDKTGWWDIMIGPGKGIDTNQYFVICSNIIGGCKGTTGPSSTNPETGKPYGLSFPSITIKDMVRVQKMLIDYLGIPGLLNVIGGSMGGMQALQWAVSYPKNVFSCCAIASTTKLSPQSIAFDQIGRLAILQDPNFNNGDYYEKQIPAKGLALARMIGHITYLSDESMHTKFGRAVKEGDTNKPFEPEFEVETYLHYQGDEFIKRFDANSYLYITKAMDYFDLSEGKKNLRETFKNAESQFLIISFTSDWLFPVYQSKEILSALKSNLSDVTYCEIKSSYGHDAFLIEIDELTRMVSNFLIRVKNNIKKKNSNKTD